MPTKLFNSVNDLINKTEENYMNVVFYNRNDPTKSWDNDIRTKLTKLFTTVNGDNSIKSLDPVIYARGLKSIQYMKDTLSILTVNVNANTTPYISTIVAPAVTTIENNKLLKLIITPRTPAVAAKISGQSNCASDLYIEYTNTGSGVRLGYIYEFNQLLYQYLYLFFDGKLIYQPLIDGFANGIFNNDVMNNNNSILDLNSIGGGKTPGLVVAANTDSQFKSAQDNGYILVRSLALVLRELITKMNNKNIREHLINDINEVPTYMKENYKTYLPSFLKVFETKIKELEQAKKLIKYLDGLRTPAPAELVYFDRTVDRLIQGYNSLRTCINEVTRQIDDKPKFFEVGKDSISEYRNLNKRLPFMPLSFENIGFTISKTFLPSNKFNGTEISYLYGTRGLFNLNPVNLTYEQIPGMKNIVDTYNSSVDARATLDAEELLKFIRTQQSLINFMIFYKKYTFTQLSQPAITMTADAVKIMYEFNGTKDMSSIINDVSSRFQDDKRADMIAAINSTAGATIGTKDRKNDRLMNVFDMNINLINVNALRRSLPFTALMNMDWTFNIMMETYLVLI